MFLLSISSLGCHSLTSIFLPFRDEKYCSSSSKWDANPSHMTPQHFVTFVRFPQQFTGTHFCTWLERGTVRVRYLRRAHTLRTVSRFKPRPPNVEPLSRCHLDGGKLLAISTKVPRGFLMFYMSIFMIQDMLYTDVLEGRTLDCWCGKT